MKPSKIETILYSQSKERVSQNMEMILKTTNLCKSFSGQTVVNNISLNIERNSVWTAWTERSWKIYNTKNDYWHFETDFWKHRI